MPAVNAQLELSNTLSDETILQSPSSDTRAFAPYPAVAAVLYIPPPPQTGTGSHGGDAPFRVIIAAYEDGSVSSRLETFFTNWAAPWETEGVGPTEPLGCVVAWVEDPTVPSGYSRHMRIFCAAAPKCLAWEPRRRWLAVGHESGQIRIFQVNRDFTASRLVETVAAHAGRVTALRYDAQDDVLVSAGRDRAVNLFSCSRGQVINSGQLGMGAGIASLAYDGPSRRIFVGTYSGNIHMFDSRFNPPRHVHTIQKAHAGSVQDLEHDSRRRYLFSCGFDGSLAVWDVDPGQRPGASAPGKDRPPAMLARLKGHARTVRALASLHGSRLLVSGDAEGRLVLWETATGRQMCALPHAHDALVTSISCPPGESSTDDRVVTASRDRTIKVWRLRQSAGGTPSPPVSIRQVDRERERERERERGSAGGGGGGPGAPLMPTLSSAAPPIAPEAAAPGPPAFKEDPLQPTPPSLPRALEAPGQWGGRERAPSSSGGGGADQLSADEAEHAEEIGPSPPLPPLAEPLASSPPPPLGFKPPL
eukprot:tig00000093_g3656.t1